VLTNNQPSRTTTPDDAVAELAKLAAALLLLLFLIVALSRRLRKLDSSRAQARMRIYAARLATDPQHTKWVADVDRTIADGIPEDELLDGEGLEQFFEARRRSSSVA
jgi:hypothetical protein